MKRWLVELGAGVAIVGAVVVVRAVVDGGDDAEPTEAADVGAGEVPLQPSGGSRNTISGVDFWAGKVEEDVAGNDWVSRGQLARYLIDYARETGDVAPYVQAQQVLEEAVALNPDSLTNRALLAVVDFALHDFAAARELAAEVWAEDADATLALAVLGDADLALGNYEAARDAYSELVALEPTAAVDVRLANLSYVTGDLAGAERLFREAADAGVSEGGERASWYAVQLSDFLLRTGRYDEAEEAAADALERFPGYYLALGAQAAVHAAAGDLDAAIAGYEAAVAAVPQPEFLTALGDLYAAIGDEAEAERQYDTFLAIAELDSGDSAGLYDRELARFLCAHDRDAARAVDLARADVAARPDTYGYDVLAWCLYRAGDLAGANDAATAALAPGIQSALHWFHAGVIAQALGDETAARTHLAAALALSPNFDVLAAPEAEAALDALGGPPESA